MYVQIHYSGITNITKCTDMGFLLNKSIGKTDKSFIDSQEVSKLKTEDRKTLLYKSLDSFSWKDTSKRDKKESAIEAYKSLAF